MKKILFFVLTIMLATGFFTISNAAEVITDRPDIKITIDGVTNNYANTPIIVNGRTLLPLRELLTNLGVTNDDQHIIWNGKENAVTAIKDSTQIYLKVGSISAKINGKTVTIDAAPVNYKGRIYIPARFAAEAFDKVVAWDNITKRIYIKDKKDYNEVKVLLDKTITLMDSVKRYKVNADDKSSYIDAEGTTDGSNNTNELNDLENKISYYTSDSLVDLDYGLYESYTVNNCYFSKFSTDTQWKKTVLTEDEFNSYFTGNDPSNLINPRDVIYAALSIEKSQDKNVTYLKGDVYNLTKDAENTPSFLSHIDQYSDTYLEIEIDNASGYINKIITKAKLQMSPDGMKPYLSVSDATYTYSEINGNFTIQLPSYIANDIKNNPNPVPPVEIVLSDKEQKVVDDLKKTSTMISVDGIYNNPYDLDNSEAILFNILKDQAAFERYNALSDNAKIVFSNGNAQDHMGEYLGCSEIHSIVMFNSKAYTEVITDYESLSSTLKLIKYDGIDKRIIIQDKEKNTFKDYTN